MEDTGQGFNGKDIKRERGEKGVWGCLTNPFTSPIQIM